MRIEPDNRLDGFVVGIETQKVCSAHVSMCTNEVLQWIKKTTGGKATVSGLLRVPNITYSLFGIGTSASRD